MGAFLTILIADSDGAWMDSMSRLLESEGYRVLRARTGVDAYYQVRMRRPDLVIMNPELPQLRGWEVCRHVKTSPETARIKVVLLTLKAEEAYRAGADGYLVKSGNIEPTLPPVRVFRYPAQGILEEFVERRVAAA